MSPNTEHRRLLWMAARELRRAAELALEAAQRAHDHAEQSYKDAVAVEYAARVAQNDLVPTLLWILNPGRAS